MAEPISFQPSETSYFSQPSNMLDPALFDGTHLRSEVRSWILNTLYAIWGQVFKAPESWSHVWVAGSGVSYQWSAARQPGDLDVLIGVDYPTFREKNSSLFGFSDTEISSYINDVSKEKLYPLTEAQNLNGKIFEVTWYVNPHATDITVINPYAAYDVTLDRWTVTPEPITPVHNREFEKKVAKDESMAREIITRYNDAIVKYQSSMNAAARINAKIALQHATQQAVALFNDIHQGRRRAFSRGGRGYFDLANYRWQTGKQRGYIQALAQIKNAHKENTEAEYSSLYGGINPDPGVDVLLRRAVLHRRNS